MAVKFERKPDGVFTLDVRGYVCPHPQLYTKKALEKMKQDELLEVYFDNPSSGESIISMCEVEGNEIVEKATEDGSTMKWTIKKGRAD